LYGQVFADIERRRTVPLKPHPTDPDKMVFVKHEYNLPKEWQGLTDEERNDCLVEADPCEALLNHEAWELMRTIEAKLKEKNT
jgi:hypothetical protein